MRPRDARSRCGAPARIHDEDVHRAEAVLDLATLRSIAAMVGGLSLCGWYAPPVLAAFLSALHVLSLGIGLGAVFARGRALRAIAVQGQSAVRSAFLPDSLWGIAALLWILTGLGRLFGGVEKSLDFYLYNGFFWVKMGMFASVFALEVVPMLTLIRWRAAVRTGRAVDTSSAPLLARINTMELVLVVLIPFAAAAMARGLWLFA